MFPNYAVNSIISTLKEAELQSINKCKQVSIEKRMTGRYNADASLSLVNSFLGSLMQKKQRQLTKLINQIEDISKDIECMGTAECGDDEEGIDALLPEDSLDRLEASYLNSEDKEERLWRLGHILSNFNNVRQFKALPYTFYTSCQGEEGASCAQQWNSNTASSVNILSSIEIDHDDSLVATAGVLKKIRCFKVPEHSSTNFQFPEADQQLIFPSMEINCNAKISCLSWNHYVRNQLAACDYDGTVSVYDASTGKRITYFEEHDKRAWSVDFCAFDPCRLASGSDDGTVRVWSTRANRSMLVLANRANVCSVRFSPTNANMLAFGCADHHVYVHDLRNPSKPLSVLRGHAKAVSYVRFINGSREREEHLLSAYINPF